MAEYTLQWLTQEEAPEALDFMNMVYSMARCPHQFLEMLPKMWEDDGKYVSNHLALKVEGRIKSIVGVYPLPTVVAGERLLFATMGNVATHPMENGKGYMNIILQEAVKKLNSMNVDGARLCGARQRYGRFGFETAGVQYIFTLSSHNILRYYGGKFASSISFRPIHKQDEEELLFCKGLFEQNGMWVDRVGAKFFYDSVTAWRNIPYLAEQDGKAVGYLTVTPDGKMVTEIGCDSAEKTLEALCAWIVEQGVEQVSLPVDPWQTDLMRKLQLLCEEWHAVTPSQFYLRNWDRVVYAFLKLKSTLVPLMDGSMDLGIKEYGTLHMTVRGGQVSVTRDDAACDFALDSMEATRFLFGMLPAYSVCDMPRKVQFLAQAWFPLPLGWNTLDRV